MQSFASAGIGYTTGLVPSGGGGFIFKALETLGSGVAVLYDTVTRDVTFTAPNGVSTMFTTANEVAGQSTPQARLFNKPNSAGGVFVGSLTIPSANGVALTYTRFATFYTAGAAPLDGHAFVFGVQTQASDVPTTGTATYTGVAGGTAILAGSPSGASLAGSTATLTANFGAGSISTVLALIMTPGGGTPTALDTLTGIGSLGAVKPGFSGTLTGSGSVTGNFAGAFFGPQAAEFGYDFLVGGTTAAGLGFTGIGGAAGKKD